MTTKSDIKQRFYDYLDDTIGDLERQIAEMEDDPSINPEYLEFMKLSKKQAQQALKVDYNVKTSGDNPMRQNIIICPGHGINQR